MRPIWKSHIIKQKTGPDDPEFQMNLQDALSQVSPSDVTAIADELAERHSRLFSGIRNDPTRLAACSAEVFSAVTHTKANARLLINYFAQHDLEPIDELMNGKRLTPLRVAAFVEKLNVLDPRLALELATGLLYNISPQANWLWTRWLWDPTTGTGILPLLAGSTHNLYSNDLMDGYVRVGAVSALSLKSGEGAGLLSPDLLSDEKRTLFANSAFLAYAYSVYMYGATSWRLSREFNRLLPSLQARGAAYPGSTWLLMGSGMQQP